MDAVEEIKSRLSIEDVVAQYVELKRSGRNFKGLSPFQTEKSPSFVVSPDKQIWHDFSSGKGGSMFSFVMEMEGVDFRGSLEILARKAGIDLEQFKGQVSNTKEKERLYEALDVATRFYQIQLRSNVPALEYLLKKRAFTKDVVLQFKLGYSPNIFDGLTKHLLAKNFTIDEIKRAGLGTQRAHGFGDMFRGRIMVPLMDAQGRVIGFTARLLIDDPDAPKYINTPQTMLYDKSRHVFGLHFAKETIRKCGYSVLVEGNLDVIASHMVGTNQVVATAGTAMTQYQLKTLSRFAPDVRLAFDEDKAGTNATERAIPIAQDVGVTLSIIDIPQGKDPDELIKKDPALWSQAIEKHSYAVDWLVNRYKQQIDLTSSQGKRKITDVVLAVVRGLKDTVEQEHYVVELANLTGSHPDAVRSKLRGEAPKKVIQKKMNEASHDTHLHDKNQLETLRFANHLTALLFMQPNVRSLHMPLEDFLITHDQQRLVHGFLLKNPQYSGSKQIPEELIQLTDYVKIITLLYEELYQGLELSELMAEASRLKSLLVRRYVLTKKNELISAQNSVLTDEESRVILSEVKKLDQLLNQY